MADMELDPLCKKNLPVKTGFLKTLQLQNSLTNVRVAFFSYNGNFYWLILFYFLKEHNNVFFYASSFISFHEFAIDFRLFTNILIIKILKQPALLNNCLLFIGSYMNCPRFAIANRYVLKHANE